MAHDPRPVRLLEADPDLGADLPAGRFECARAALTVPVTRLHPGLWLPPVASAVRHGRLGVLVLEGALIREIAIADRTGAELVGQGDLLSPYHHLGLEAPIPSDVGWRTLTPTTLATIDRRFVLASGPFPEILLALAWRAVIRAQTLGVVLAIAQLHGIKQRLLVLLWHLGDRYGRVGEEGVALPLPLTHLMLSRIVGASRPTVSTAIKELEDDARIARLPGGGFKLIGEPPVAERTGA